MEAPFTEPREDEPPSLENMEDEICSPTQNSLRSDRYTNIYVHDGHFDGDGSDNITAPQRRKIGNSSSASNISHGLIPPVFYSRISSPSTSNNSSNSSLNNLSLLPGTFSKLLAPKIEAQGQNNSSNNTSSSLFGKDLINKSFEEVRKKPILLNHELLSDKFGLALSFHPNKKIPSLEADEEDLLMSGCISSHEDETIAGTSDVESSNTLISGKLHPLKELNSTSQNKLNIQIYEDSTQNRSGSESVSTIEMDHTQQDRSNEEPGSKKPTYNKPKFTLDLYGDDDINSSGGWILGGNAR